MDKQKEWFSKVTIWFPIIMGISLIISVMIGSYVFYKIKALEDVLSVTGSASKEVVADQAKFSGDFSRVTNLSSLKYGYDQMARDLSFLKTFLKSQGIDEKNIIISPVLMNEIYDGNNNKPEKEYTLRQNIEIASTDVSKMATLAQATVSLINSGVIFTTNPVQYYYSKLPDVRVSLLSDAVKDARARAEKISESTGRKVGSVKSASSGVVQVLPRNSLDVSDYGTYDTSTVDKNIMVTVRVTFSMK